MITGFIFRNIFQTSRLKRKVLLIGYFGISKTYSFLLYSILSQKVIHYKLTKNKQKQKNQREEIINAPKIIYLSYQAKQQFVQSLQNNIKVQCNDLLNSNKTSLTLKEIKKEYAKHKIKFSLIIDQINKIARANSDYYLALKIRSQVKRKNQHQSYQKIILLFKEKINEIFKVAWEQIQIQYLLAKKTMNFINENINLFDSIIFLSPVNIQKSVSHFLNLGGQAGHQDIGVLSIDYPQLFKQQFSKKQIVDYFLFQQHQRFLLNLKEFKQFYYSLDCKDIMVKQKIRKTLFDKISSNPYIFTTPLLIRISLVEQWKHYKQKNKDKIIDNIEDLSVHNFLEHFKLSTSTLKQKVNDFLNTKNLNDQQRKNLIIELYYEARNILKQQPDEIYAPSLNIKISNDAWQRVKQKADKHLFKFDDNDKTFKCLLPAILIVNLLCPFVSDTLKNFSKQPILSRLFDNFRQSVKDQILQDMFIGQITKGQPLLTIQKKQKLLPTYKQSKYHHKFIVSFRFQKEARNKIQPKKNYCFLKSLLPSFENIVKNQRIRNNDFLPTIAFKQLDVSLTLTTKFDQSLIDRYSNIDFSIIQINNASSDIIINAFDVTIGNQQNTNMKKLDDFISDYIYFTDFDQTQTTLNGRKYTIHLRYYVLASNLESILWNKNTNLSALKDKSNGKLQFRKQADNDYILNVRGSNQQSVLLDQIGFIDIKNDVTVSNQKQDISIEKAIFDKLCLSKRKSFLIQKQIFYFKNDII